MRCGYFYRKIAKSIANSGDPDQMLRSVTSDLGLHCLPITLLRVCRYNGLMQLFLKILSGMANNSVDLAYAIFSDHFGVQNFRTFITFCGGTS